MTNNLLSLEAVAIETIIATTTMSIHLRFMAMFDDLLIVTKNQGNSNQNQKLATNFLNHSLNSECYMKRMWGSFIKNKVEIRVRCFNYVFLIFKQINSHTICFMTGDNS